VTSSTKALIGVLLAGMAGILIFLFVHLSNDPAKPLTIGASKAAACTASDTCLPSVTFVDTNGAVYDAKALEGKVVVVNFWATWCKPCNHEIPDLSKVYAKYKERGLVILGVLTSDDPDPNQLLNFQSDHEMTYPVIRGDDTIIGAFRYPRNLPTTFVFDRGGKQIGDMHVGGMHEADLADIVEPLLAEK
jgi:thiol-disulfide isomerase/thioredoxin